MFHVVSLSLVISEGRLEQLGLWAFDDRAVVTWSCVGSINGLALALGGSGAGSPATANDSRDQTTTSSRATSPPPNERQQHSR